MKSDVIGGLKQTVCFSDDEVEDGNSPSDSEFDPNNKKEVKLFTDCLLFVINRLFIICCLQTICCPCFRLVLDQRDQK